MKKYVLPTLISLALTLPVFAEETASTSTPPAKPVAPPETAVHDMSMMPAAAPPSAAPVAPPAHDMDSMMQEIHLLHTRLMELQQQVQKLQSMVKSPSSDMAPPSEMAGKSGDHSSHNTGSDQPSSDAMKMGDMKEKMDAKMEKMDEKMKMGGMGGCSKMKKSQQSVEDSLSKMESMLKEIVEKTKQ